MLRQRICTWKRENSVKNIRKDSVSGRQECLCFSENSVIKNISVTQLSQETLLLLTIRTFQTAVIKLSTCVLVLLFKTDSRFS